MAQHDYVIANGTGAAVRSDLNNGLAAIVSQNSGATEPATMYAYQWWADTTTGLLKIRNSANNAWVTVGTLASANLGLAALASPTFTGTVTAPTFTASTAVNIPLGSAGSPTLFFTGDSNTGLFSPGADAIALATDGTNRLHITSGGLVGIGTTSPATTLDVNGDVTITDKIIHGGDTNTAIRFPAADTVTVETAGSERARIDSSGRLLVGTSSARSNLGSTTPLLQAETATTSSSASASLSLVNNQGAGGAPPAINLGLTRSASIGGTTKVESTDELGLINFLGSDGTNFIPGARISSTVDGTTGTNDMPGRLVFSTTADGASSPTERMRIGNDGYNRIFAGSSVFVAMTGQGAGTTYSLIDGNHSATSIGSGNGTNVFKVWSNGNVQNTNGSYTTLSDAKLKENIADAGSQWDDLKAIQIRNWNFKAETGHETHRQIGPIAQELEAVCPGLVFETPDRDEDGNETGEVTKGVNQSVLYMKAVKALQEAMERIEQLETSNADLLARVTALESA